MNAAKHRRTSQCNIRLTLAERQRLDDFAEHWGVKPYEALRLILHTARPTEHPLVRWQEHNTDDDDTPEDRAVALLGRLGWTCTPPKLQPAQERRP